MDEKILEILKELRSAIICLRDEVKENGVDIYETTLNGHLRRANELMNIWRED